MPCSGLVAVKLFETLEIDWAKLTAPCPPVPPSSPAEGQGTLCSMTADGLRSVEVLLAIHRDAVSRGYLADSEAGLLNFLSTAACCLRRGRNPAALFRYLVERSEFPASLEDEDRAHLALKNHRRDERAGSGFLKLRAPAEGNSRPSLVTRPAETQNAASEWHALGKARNCV